MTLSELLKSLLQLAAEALDAREADPDVVGAEGAPERQLVEHGQVSIDASPDECTPMLAVLWRRVAPLPARDVRAQDCVIITQIEVAVELRRCSPTIDGQGFFPSPDEETEANSQMADDTMAIWKGITRAVTTGEWPVGVSCQRVQMLNAEAIPPNGAVMGSRIVIRVTP